jgi:hypothetical protein
MKSPIDIEDEIDVIRDKIYAGTKNMSPEERAAYINSKAEAVMKQLKMPDNPEERIFNNRR